MATGDASPAPAVSAPATARQSQTVLAVLASEKDKRIELRDALLKLSKSTTLHNFEFCKK